MFQVRTSLKEAIPATQSAKGINMLNHMHMCVTTRRFTVLFLAFIFLSIYHGRAQHKFPFGKCLRPHSKDISPLWMLTSFYLLLDWMVLADTNIRNIYWTSYVLYLVTFIIT